MKRFISVLCLPVMLFSAELKDSLIQSKKEQKPLVVMVTSTTCKYCDKMKEETLGNITIKKNLKGFLFTQIDKEHPEAQRFLPAIGMAPTIFFVSPDWKIINTQEGYLPPKDFNPYVLDTRNQMGMSSVSGEKSAENQDKWISDIDTAMSLAAQNGKQIMVFVQSSRSKYSKLLEQKALSDANVMHALENFVFVKVDYGDKKAKKYGINPSGVPSVYFMTAEMEELALAEGYFEANDFLAWVNYAKSKI